MTDEEDIPLRRQRRSVSQLLSYSSCSEQYRLERVARAPSKPAAWFVQGRAVHEAIEAWEDSGRKMASSALDDLYRTAYINEANALLEKTAPEHWLRSGIKKVETDLSDRLELGSWQVADYIAYAIREQDLWEVVVSEVEFTIEIGGVVVYGFIDQVRRCKVTGVIYAADIKSGNTVPPHPVQLAVYREALVQMKPADSDDVISNRAEWIHLGKTGTKSKAERNCEAIEVKLEDWPVERVERWIYDMDQAEKAGIYLPNPGDKCERMCGVRQWCRVIGWHYGSVLQYSGDLIKEQDERE